MKNNRNFAIVTALSVLSLSGLGCVTALGNGPPTEAERADFEASSSEIRGLGAATQDKYIAFVNGEFGVTLSPGDSTVELNVFEQNPADEEYFYWSARADTSFDVLSVCARHANEYYVYGVMTDGTAVLERWDLGIWPVGAYHTEREAATTPMGVSIRPSQTSVYYTGVFLDPSLRTTPVLTRTALVAPQGLGAVSQSEVDPEGRFMIFRVTGAGGSSIIQYSLAPGGTPSVIATPVTEPELVRTENIRFVDSSVEGRMLACFGSGLIVLHFVDADNDGLFESSLELTKGEELLTALPNFTLTWLP